MSLLLIQHEQRELDSESAVLAQLLCLLPRFRREEGAIEHGSTELKLRLGTQSEDLNRGN
jgi:hypothetical protein